MNVDRLRGAIRDAKNGPDLFPTSFGHSAKLSKAAQEEINRRIRLWLDTWIIPAMVEALPKPRVRK